MKYPTFTESIAVVLMVFFSSVVECFVNYNFDTAGVAKSTGGATT